MKTKENHIMKRFAPVLVAVAGLCLGLSACSNDGGSSGAVTAAPLNSSNPSNVEEAAAAVAAARGPVEFAPPAPAFDTSGVQGKRVQIVMFSSQFPILAQWRDVATTELERLGVEVSEFDGKADPTEWARGVQQGIDTDADLIVTVAIPQQLIANQIEAAKSAGIPVVTVIGAPGGAYPGADSIEGVATDVTYDYRVPGKLIADWFVAESEGKGKAIVIEAKGNPSSDTEAKALLDEIARLCPDCDVQTLDAQPPTWSDGTLESQIRSALQADPDRTYVLPVFDGMTLGTDPAVQKLGLGSTVKQGTFNAEIPQLQGMAGGSSVQMNVGGSNEWFGLAIADSALRVLAGQQPIDDHKIGFRVFDTENVNDINLDAEDGLDWYGIDFVSEYRALWQ